MDTNKWSQKLPENFFFAQTQKNLLFKITLSTRVRNFVAPKEPLNIKKNYFKPKSPSYRDFMPLKSRKSERSKISHLGTLK
jgi:hypothetical protein